MKVRAVALADERSNAIGTVELECTPFALVIAYLGVAAFAEGYAPAALTHGTLVSVPYPEIEQARFEGERLYLQLAKERTPHHRLLLGGFSIGDGTHRHELYRQRLVLRSTAFGFALVAALLAAVIVPRVSPHSSATAAIVIATTAAALVLGLGFFLDRRLITGRLEGEAAMRAFAADLGMYLPGLVRRVQGPLRPVKTLAWPDFQGMLPRTTAAIVITLTAGGLASVLISKWMLRSTEPVARLDASRHGEVETPLEVQAPAPLEQPALGGEQPRAHDVRASAASPAPAAVPALPTRATPPSDLAPSNQNYTSVERLGACRCERPISALWQTPVPKLSVIVLGTKLHQSGTRKELALDIAVVNNSDQELSDVTLRVNFYERDPGPAGRRHFSKHRVLFFEGPLVPGQAIKWSTEARGVEFELENPVAGDIGPGGDGAASSDAFRALLAANHRPVRLHGAMMLAYLGDPRARAATLELQDALREEEAAYLRRILAALSELKACEFAVSEAGDQRSVSACVFNTSTQKQDQLRLRVNALERPVSLSHPIGAPPTVLGEGTWSIPGALAAGEGTRIKTTFDLGQAKATSATAFEMLVGRGDQNF